MAHEVHGLVLQARAVALSGGDRLEVRGLLDSRWRKALSLRGRTARYTDRVHALILFLARLRVGRLAVEGSEDGWAPYDCIAQLPGWEQCHDRQLLRETLLHELDLVTGHFFQRSTLDGQPRIRIAQPPGTIVLDDDAEMPPRGDQLGCDRAAPKRDDTGPVSIITAAAAPPLEDAVWAEPGDFADGVAVAVRTWLAAIGISADARVVHGTRLDQPGAHRVSLPLAEDAVLVVEPHDGVSSRWGDAIGSVSRYVSEQTRRFSAIVEANAGGLILASPAIRTALARVLAAAHRGMRLMLVGASGSGKDGLARCYHRLACPEGPFVRRNCSLFSRDLLRTELFGAERGAFTGAAQRMIGAVELAHGGTLFLDEIGEMSVDLQSQLLSFLDHGEYSRLGSVEALRADVRVVCATNGDLRESVSRGAFRMDLWYRLAGEIVEVPALRERPADIEAYLRSRLSSHGVSLWDRLTPDAVAMILEHPWEGNFRELAHFAARFDQEDSLIDGQVCRRALMGVALGTSRPAAQSEGSSSKWGALAQRAAEAFAEDFGREASSWDDLKGYIEQYFKPLLFAHLSGADAASDEAEPRQLANRIQVDRGTAYKQLARYRERFRR